MKSTSVSMASLTRKAIFVTLSFIILATVLLTFSPSPKLMLRKDYNQLIDVPFNFLYAPVCKQNNNFLILVHTSPANLHRRDLLRQSWANANKTDVEIFFLTGLHKNKTYRMKMNEEIRKYKNFIYGDFLDTYENLTYKHVMGLKYVFYHCPKIDYVVKVDDDIFVNVHILKSFFKMFRQRYGQTKNILCHPRIGHPVLRDGKWAVSTKDYPNSTYPPHCPGFALIYPRKAIELLYPIAQKTKYFWIDDVHVTGTVAKEAGVGHVDISSLSMNLDELTVITDKKLVFEMRPILFGPDEIGVDDFPRINEHMSLHGRRASILDYIK